LVSEAFVGSEGSAPSSSNGAGRGGENLGDSPFIEICEKDILMEGGIISGFLGTAGLTSGPTEG